MARIALDLDTANGFARVALENIGAATHTRSTIW